jgi:uncharacterized membrane protein
MAVLIVLFGSLLLFATLGRLGVQAFSSLIDCGRYALAAMFTFTAVSHFAPPTRSDLIAMVPPGLPRPDLLVYSTGVAEFAGAAGLLFEPTRQWAAVGLMLLLLAMFPANVSAVRRGNTIRGRPVTPLWIRAPMQVLFLAWAWWVR